MDDEAGGSDTITVFITVCEGAGSPSGVSFCTAPPFRAITISSSITFSTYVVGTPITDLVLPTASGGTGTNPLFLYTLTSIPAGLSFDPDTRTLSGTPTVAGVTAVTYTLRDAASGIQLVRTIALIVAAEGPPALPAPDDQSYTVNVAIADLTLPAGLTFDATSRTLSGTPGTVATTELTYTVTDSAIRPRVDTQTFTVTVAAQPAFPDQVDIGAAPNAGYVDLYFQLGVATANIVLPAAAPAP